MIFHEDILVDILSRLPAKSTGQFRCVSKAWRTLLSQPQFVKTHLNRLKRFPFEEELIILVSLDSGTLASLFSAQLKTSHHILDRMTAVPTKLRFVDHYIDIKNIVQNLASCDGLVLVEDHKGLFLLINPTTKEIKELPKSPYALDHRATFTMYGIGYDSVSDDYKVVMLSYYSRLYVNYTDLFGNVYSVKNGTWKRAVSPPNDHAAGDNVGVFANGHIHWLQHRAPDFYPSVIVSFDLAQENFHELPGPPTSFDSEKFPVTYLSTIGGCLCMYAWSCDSGTDVWVMKEYGVRDSWTKFAIVNTAMSLFTPLCFVGKEQVVLLNELAFCADRKLVVYNLKEGRFEDIVVQSMPDDFLIIGACMQSLVSPHCIVEGTDYMNDKFFSTS